MLITTPQLKCEYKAMSQFFTKEVTNFCPDDSINDHRGAVSTMDITIIATAFSRITVALMTEVVTVK